MQTKPKTKERLLHYSNQPLGALYSVEQTNRMKPTGLWVSVEEAWAEWCRDESFGLERLTHVSHVILEPQANLLHLRGPTDIDAFTEEYASKESNFHVDWQTVAARHQGIVITPYCYGRRLSPHTGWYYGWDCASGCIWDASAIQSVRLVLPKE